MMAKTAIASPKALIEGEHLIGKFFGDTTGATLLVVGSVYGNEPSGAAALRNISRQLEDLREKLYGRVYFLAGNTRALTRGVRFIGADLNRHWTSENLEKNKSNSFSPQIAEDYEQNELLALSKNLS
jgi:succinylglutamate desuccinylase